MRAVVVFTDIADGGWAWVLNRLLEPGFRHCHVAIENGPYWIVLDMSSGRFTASVVAATEFDLADFHRGHGRQAMETEAPVERLFGPIMPATCVGLVKRVLGIRASRVQTPKQLFDHLQKEQ